MFRKKSKRKTYHFTAFFIISDLARVLSYKWWGLDSFKWYLPAAYTDYRLQLNSSYRLLSYEWWGTDKCKCYLPELTVAYSWTVPARPGSIACPLQLQPQHRSYPLLLELSRAGRRPGSGPFGLVASFCLAIVPEVWPVSSWGQLYGQGVGSITQLTHPPLHKPSIHRPVTHHRTVVIRVITRKYLLRKTNKP